MLLRQNENLPKSFVSLLTKFTVDGNRIKVEKALLSTLKLIKKHTKSSPFFFFFDDTTELYLVLKEIMLEKAPEDD